MTFNSGYGFNSNFLSNHNHLPLIPHQILVFQLSECVPEPVRLNAIEDDIGIRRAARNKYVHWNNLMDCPHTGRDSQFRVKKGIFPLESVLGVSTYARFSESSRVKKLRMAGTPPKTAQSPSATRILQRARICLATCSLYVLLIPPSKIPTVTPSIIRHFQISNRCGAQINQFN